MPSAWRIVKRQHAARAFDGEGARLYGGRWSSPGTPLVYLAESRSLALLEILVHLHDEAVLARYVRFEVGYRDAHRAELDPATLPASWRESPPPPALARIGDEWVAARRSLLLAVPSAIVPEERVLLLNPAHPRMGELAIAGPEPVRIDPRLA
jgi:RES domain-containing protein